MCLIFVFFKQKTAYEMRISDRSSDVCSSDLDLVVVATEDERPMRFSLGLSNHGTELTGRYRAQVGVAWDAPLGLGDAFSASYVHALDPQQSNQGALSYTIPITDRKSTRLNSSH